jgi:cell division protein FtsI (penicillin-binding protein 3)
MPMEKPPGLQASKSTERLLIAGLILCGWAVILVLRLLDLQVLAHDGYVRIAESQQDKLRVIDAPRGAIVDRNGSYLAISSASQFVVVNPKRIPNKGFAAALLGRVLHLDAAQLERDLEAVGASKRRHGYFVVDTHVSPDKAEALRAMKLDWLEISEGSLRSYPNGQLAAHVLGGVNSEGHGSDGIELKLNKELEGKPGMARVSVDVKQRAYSSEIATAPVMGKSIGLTIDSELQHVAEQALEKGVTTYHAQHGSVVAMDPRTGEILALANYPTFDPNERLHAGDKPHGREDLAVVAPFEPGSVFKIITFSAALETTKLRPQTIINCGNGSIKIFGRVVHDHKSYSALPMQDVLAFSSNIGAIRIGMQVGNQNLYEYIRRFGFGRKTGIELPAEARGLLRPLKRWQPTSIGSVPMGHEIGVTSLQLAQAGSAIANGGFLVHPHLVAWKQAPGEPKQMMQYPAPVQILAPQTIETMQMMMRRVITEPGGTGHRLHIPGYAIAGKTGTAQIYDFAHRVYTHKYNASFMGFAPLRNPAVLVVVTITGTTGEAGYGGSAAGPVFVRTMSTALARMGIQRDVPEEIEELIASEKSVKKGADADDVAIAELSNPPTEEEMKQASADSEADGLPRVPNFVGKTMQDVMEEAAENALELEITGDGVARAQSPAAGSMLTAGEHIRVRFSR